MRHIVITGGNKGIGLALTQKFVEAGDHVQIIARDFSHPSHFDYQNHPLVTCTAFDLTDLEELPALVDSIDSIDVLINNAGLLQQQTYDSYTDPQRDYSLALNIMAPVKLIELLADKLKVTSEYTPRVVNNASIAGQIGHPDIWYGISKAGLINATKSFSKAFEGTIIVNAVAPSPTETDMLDNIPQHRQQAFLKNTIAGRFATADEVAESIYWLATESPEYINGICLDINNGSFPR
ncbi:SDR family oxidoreductase [Thiomicrorhabdus arctica]|jgi:3-oxoacyl-[acyl-carrier protein] reductase|uniref:SDR family oxidoreductase n=1 Tax=Thiomicrorhabdus arctica TaxID=131540 RepID=UPI0003683B8A|nr:SDR family oxidoreductase [Thiomicrorhabdus arctica]